MLTINLCGVMAFMQAMLNSVLWHSGKMNQNKPTMQIWGWVGRWVVVVKTLPQSEKVARQKQLKKNNIENLIQPVPQTT